MAKKSDINKSALKEQAGIKPPETLNSISAKSIKAKRQKQPTVDNLVSNIISGDITALSRAITLVESTNTKHFVKAQSVISKCLEYANNSVRIGITGVPGVGKSTFIEAFGTQLIRLGKKVAVLAVDPSSSLSKGSILGDKTRMEELVKTENAFIRPSPTGNSLGGVARKTRETIMLCEAAGFDTIIIETVGVGQSETVVHSMVDFFLLLKLAGAGDDLQGIKRGIIEMADAIVINKADGANIEPAKMAKVEFSSALHLYPEKASGWLPKVLLISALKNEGISEVWELIQKYFKQTQSTNYFEVQRNSQNKFWVLQTIDARLKSNFYNSETLSIELKKQLELVEAKKTTPFAAAEYLLGL